MLLLLSAAAYAGIFAVVLSVLLLLSPAGMPLSPERYDPMYVNMVCHGVCAIGLLVAATLVKNVSLVRRSVSTGVARLVLLILIVGVMVSSDRVVGLIYPPRLRGTSFFELHPQRGWTNEPNACEHSSYYAGWGTVRLDSYGFRIDETGPPPSYDGRHRILFMGDSVTFGFGHPERDTYGALTVAWLNKHHPGLNAVSLNGAVVGYDLGQTRHRLVDEGFELEPHLVVLGVCLNDFVHPFDPRAGRDGLRHREFNEAQEPDHWSGWRRATLAWGRSLFYGAPQRDQPAFFEHMNLAELLTEPWSSNVLANWQRGLHDLGEIVKACRERNVPLVMVLFPVMRQLENREGSIAPQKRLGEFAELEETFLLDLLPVFMKGRSYSRRTSHVVFMDETHPTALGHRLTAQALVELIESKGLLPEISQSQR